MSSTELSKAKINLNLHILGRRPDGYHELFSLVCFADYGDDLSFVVGGRCDQLEVKGPFGDDITGENIILKASALLRHEVKDVPFGTFSLVKKLPVASGMGGGSANAAAALRLLSCYVPQEFEEERWQKIALQLGADVPVCLKGEAVYMSGIGEKLSLVSGGEPYHAVLINPLRGVSTASIFQKLNAEPLDEVAAPHSASRCLSFDPAVQSFEDYLCSSWNDLENAAMAFEPSIKEVLITLQHQEGCFLSRMSGSGATCFGLFKTKNMAHRAVEDISKYSNDWWVKQVVIG